MQIPNYVIKEIIGQGGMATVYRSEHVLLKQERAIKVMSPELSREPGFQESFIREGQKREGMTGFCQKQSICPTEARQRGYLS